MSITIAIKRPPRLGYIQQDFPEAVVTVVGIDYRKPEAVITLEFKTSASGQVFDVMQRRFAPSAAPGALDFVTQAYAHIKTLPEFVGAIDS